MGGEKQYTFNTKIDTTDEGKVEYYCQMHASYDDIFFGLNKEYKTLQTKKENFLILDQKIFGKIYFRTK